MSLAVLGGEHVGPRLEAGQLAADRDAERHVLGRRARRRRGVASAMNARAWQSRTM